MEASSGLIQYTLILDNAPFPDLPDSDLQLSARPDPTGFTLVVTPVSLEVDSAIVRITVRKGKRGRREGRGKEGGERVEGEGGRSGNKKHTMAYKIAIQFWGVNLGV